MRRVKVSPGFWGLLVLVWAVEPTLLLPTALAAACHELGHCAALGLTGAGVGRLKLSAVGAELVPRRSLSYAAELPTALAGPGVSLLCAFFAARWGFYLFAGLSLALGLFNLLPIHPLDGSRALQSLCALVLPTTWAQRLPKWLGVITAGLLLGAAVKVFLRLGGLSLLALALWLCYKNIKALLDG